MSEWRVALSLSDGSSNKFWRARVEGGTLYVNYGRTGSAGQTQVKDLGSPAAAEKEITKLEREKRNKGYVDEGAPPKPAPAAAPVVVPAAEEPPSKKEAAFRLHDPTRNVDLELTLDGTELKTTVLEKYETPKAAREAYERLVASVADEGYRPR